MAQTVHDDLDLAGVAVAFATEDLAPDSVILLESADWWGPVLTFGGGVVATAIYDGIKTAIGRAREANGKVRAHLDLEELIEVTGDTKRQIRTTSLSGDPKTVLDGLERVLRDRTAED